MADEYDYKGIAKALDPALALSKRKGINYNARAQFLLLSLITEHGSEGWRVDIGHDPLLDVSNDGDLVTGPRVVDGNGLVVVEVDTITGQQIVELVADITRDDEDLPPALALVYADHSRRAPVH